MRRWLEPVSLWILMGLIVLWSTFPIYLIVMASLKDPREIFEFPPRLWGVPTLENYRMLWARWPEFFKSLTNSLYVTGGAALMTLVLSSAAAYAYSRYQGRSLQISAFLMLAIRMFPPLVITIPLFPLLYTVGLIDKHFTLIILYATFFVSLSTWLMKSFIDEVPVQLEEAARIDGCNTFQVLTKITLPLVRQGMAATTIFVAIYAWNEFMFAFLFTSADARTAPLVISEMMGSITGVQWGPLFAAATIQLLPMLLFVWAIQSHLIRGMTAGSVKG